MFLVRNPGLTDFLLKDDYVDIVVAAGSGAIDLEQFFSHQDLYYSSEPPSGALWLAIQNGDLVRRDNSNTVDVPAISAFYDPVWRYSPNEGQWEALVGTQGIPSSTNRYVTELDYGVPATTTTTDDVSKVLYTLSVPNNSMTLVTTRVVGVRTAGLLGNIGDCASFIEIAVVKNIAGVVSVRLVESAYTYRDQKTWEVSFTPGVDAVNVEVKGALGNNITWNGKTAGQVQVF